MVEQAGFVPVPNDHGSALPATLTTIPPERTGKGGAYSSSAFDQAGGHRCPGARVICPKSPWGDSRQDLDIPLARASETAFARMAVSAAPGGIGGF